MAIENLSDLSAMGGRFFCTQEVSNTFIKFMVDTLSNAENLPSFYGFGATNE